VIIGKSGRVFGFQNKFIKLIYLRQKYIKLYINKMDKKAIIIKINQVYLKILRHYKKVEQKSYIYLLMGN